MNKAVIYIDGQNLSHRLRSMSLQEKDIKWDTLFNDILEPNYNLIRVYWYQAAKIYPWKWNSKSAHQNLPAGIQNIQDYQAKAEDAYKVEIDRLDKIHNEVYSRLEESFEKIEFRYVGVLKIDPYDLRQDKNGNFYAYRTGEKGVDVGLAVDMVRHAPHYDQAILISGDYDFVPAVQAVKDQLKSVRLVSFQVGTPPTTAGHARRLKGLCDTQHEIFESDLKNIYKR